MTRRAILLALLATGCTGGLSERPYTERRQWPLLIRRERDLPPRKGGRVLEVRGLRAGPGLETRGLQELQRDGSVRTDFYEEWAVPPAQGAEDALRLWLAGSGRFAAVVATGSRMPPDLVLEGELTVLWSQPTEQEARAAIAITLLDQREAAPRIRLQKTFTGRAVLGGTGAPAAAQAQLAALRDVFGQIEAAVS
jgi:cholesterol transport system auxiliary component